MRFLFRDDLTESVYRQWTQTAAGMSAEVVLFYDGQKAEKLPGDVLNVKDIFSVDADAVYGIGFEERLIRLVAGINSGLPGNAMQIYEYLCRLVIESGRCQVIAGTAGESMDPVGLLLQEPLMEHMDDLAFSYAYAMRLHMGMLHTQGVMDTVFQSVCELMQGKGCFPLFQQYMQQFLSDQESFERLAGYTAPFLVLRGDDTCGGVLQQFADDLTESLVANGQAVIEIGDADYDYNELQGRGIKGIVGFQAPALEIDFFRKLQGPKFQFWFDHPLHFAGIMQNLPEDQYVLCQDGNYALLIRKYFHTKNAMQFPPGGRNLSYWEGERPYDIVFLGTCFADEGDSLTGMQKQFYDYMLERPSLTFEQGLREMRGWTEEDTLQNAKTEALFLQDMMELKPACRSVLGCFRNRVIKTLLDAGFELHVYGESWNVSPFVGYANLIRHPNMSPVEGVEELQKAKIGLNVMSWHKAGMTERIANIMLAGAVCLSDETSYLRENTEDGREIVLYRLEELTRLPERIRELLQNSEKRERIAKSGYEKAMREFSWDARAKQLIALAETRLQPEESIRIFVATHVTFQPPQNPIYTPLHVGRSGKPDLGYLGDDTGENISDLNFLYGELTGLYWIWQNVEGIDYAGLCHYRRYFINGSFREMQKEEYLAILQEYDAIVPKAMECDGGNTYYEQFAQAHNSHDLDAVARALKKLYPEYADAFDTAMQGKIFYWGNLVVTSLAILKAYAEWLFTIFAEAGEEIDVSGYDAYHRRVYGFLSEQMFYVFALANHLKLHETAVGVSGEKAETKELKMILRQMITEGRGQEAKKLLDDRLKERPDLMLENSDLGHELRDIYEQLNHL